MNMDRVPITRVITIKNAQGLHARPAELFSRRAKEFQSRIDVIREGRRVEAKSIIDLLTLGAGPGTELVLEAEGSDAEAALDALVRLVETGFAEETENEHQ